MTTSIADSWELPSYVAGDLVPMEDYEDRRRDRITNWEQAGDAPVVNFQKAKRYLQSRPKPMPQPEPDWGAGLRRLEEIQPPTEDDLAKYHRGDLMSQDQIDRLRGEGFYPDEDGSWHRPVTHANGDPIAAHHILTYEPGHRRPTNNERAPWILSTDPETVGIAFPHLHGAISAANADRDQIRHMSKVGAFLGALSRLLTKTAAEQTPAQIAAQKWLDEHADDFEEWHPSPSDYTYSDFGDTAGQTFHGDEAHSHVLPGSEYDFGGGMSDDDWERFHQDREDRWQNRPDMLDEPGEEENQDEYQLEQHGFNWQRRGDPSRTPPGEHEAGEYVRHQHDPEGNHLATHVIHYNPHTQRWNLESSPADTPGFSDHSSAHGWVSDAIDQYRQNAAERLLPQHGYEPDRGRTGWVRSWTRTDPGGYEHEIHFPEEGGFTGRTTGGRIDNSGPVFARGGQVVHNADDLADVVREQNRLGRGQHPGGEQDYRLTRDELLSNPSVARLGQPGHMSDNFYGDNKVGSAHWHWQHPEWPHPINAEATYNWDKGGYDFKYTTDGTRLAPSHNYVPEGAPVHVPGRQSSLF